MGFRESVARMARDEAIDEVLYTSTNNAVDVSKDLAETITTVSWSDDECVLDEVDSEEVQEAADELRQAANRLEVAIEAHE
jgi:hypothetical protein